MPHLWALVLQAMTHNTLTTVLLCCLLSGITRPQTHELGCVTRKQRVWYGGRVWDKTPPGQKPPGQNPSRTKTLWDKTPLGQNPLI